MDYQLAVYGTLKKGYGNHGMLAQCEFVGTSWVENFAMVREGSYPAAFRFAGNKIRVEVYKVDEVTLAYTDRLEGVDTEYYERVTVKTEHGDAFMYAMPKRDLKPGFDKWYPSGMWSGPHHSCVQWAGWQQEIRMLDEAKEREKARQPHNLYNPPDKKSGQMVKVHNTETGEVEYVSIHDAVYSHHSAEWRRKTEKEYDAANWIRNNGSSSNVSIIPVKSEPVVVIRTPTNHEKARALIREGMEKNSKIPDEAIA